MASLYGQRFLRFFVLLFTLSLSLPSFFSFLLLFSPVFFLLDVYFSFFLLLIILIHFPLAL